MQAFFAVKDFGSVFVILNILHPIFQTLPSKDTIYTNVENSIFGNCIFIYELNCNCMIKKKINFMKCCSFFFFCRTLAVYSEGRTVFCITVEPR